jgi:GNAT superfamily N-acetyltransferase
MSASSRVTVISHVDPQPELEAMVDAGLDEFNASVDAFRGELPLSCAARDATGVVIGGAVGRMLGRCCELKMLWVHKAHRHCGVGGKLVRAFEERATAHGCSTSYLWTFSFQATGFYERLGYTAKLELPGHGAAGSKFVMVRELTSEAAG